MASRFLRAGWLAVASSLLLLPIPVHASPIDGGAQIARAPVDYPYRNYSQIRDILLSLETTFPEILHVVDIGDSWEKHMGFADRDMLAVKISDNVAVDEGEPEVLIMALHHAREWTTSEVAVCLIENLTRSHGSDSRISWLIDNREIWIVPVVNPDGLDYALETDEWWRKNRRLNYDGTYGVDLNRNYNGSENGDPAGSWGGVGTSSNPGDATYCGESPFSEPETQAIRDLVLAHDFRLAIDFHSYGDWVLWPWGYTLSPAPDDYDLTRIGTRLAALSGYSPLQSSETYLTTGDSVDWMYGGAGIYSYCIELGGSADGFHPARERDVLAIIDEGVPMAVEAIEIAGDREERWFNITHSPSSEWDYSSTGFEVSATITSDRGIDTSSLQVSFRAANGSWEQVQMVRGGSNDSYLGAIPAHDPGTRLDYYIVAEDLGGVLKMSPEYAPYQLHSATVVDNEPPLAEAGLDILSFSGVAVVFDGTGSTDNHGISNYTWILVHNGSEVLLYGPAPSYTFWTPGDYLVTLTVTDSSDNSASDVVTVTVYDDGSIPEFEGPLTAVTGLILILAVLSLLRRRKRLPG